MAFGVIQGNLFFGPLNNFLREQGSNVKRACPEGRKGVRLNPILQMAEISIATGQAKIPHRDKNEICQMFHCFHCSLSNTGVELHGELQFFSSFSHLVGTFTLFSPRITLICACISLCTLNKHLLKLAV